MPAFPKRCPSPSRAQSAAAYPQNTSKVRRHTLTPYLTLGIATGPKVTDSTFGSPPPTHAQLSNVRNSTHIEMGVEEETEKKKKREKAESQKSPVKMCVSSEDGSARLTSRTRKPVKEVFTGFVCFTLSLSLRGIHPLTGS